jgi:hypothetical protein
MELTEVTLYLVLLPQQVVAVVEVALTVQLAVLVVVAVLVVRLTTAVLELLVKATMAAMVFGARMLTQTLVAAVAQMLSVEHRQQPLQVVAVPAQRQRFRECRSLMAAAAAVDLEEIQLGLVALVAVVLAVQETLPEHRQQSIQAVVVAVLHLTVMELVAQAGTVVQESS